MSRPTVKEWASQRRSARNEKVLAAAVALAKADDYQWITRRDVAKAAGVSVGSVSNFGSIVDLKRAVLHYAVENCVVEIVAQGLAAKSPIAQAAPPEVKAAVAAYLLQ